MTLFDCTQNSEGNVRSIGCDRETHRRLVDMGLLGGSYRVRAKKKKSLLADFADEFSAVIERATAEQIEVIEKQ